MPKLGMQKLPQRDEERNAALWERVRDEMVLRVHARTYSSKGLGIWEQMHLMEMHRRAANFATEAH